MELFNKLWAAVMSIPGPAWLVIGLLVSDAITVMGAPTKKGGFYYWFYSFSHLVAIHVFSKMKWQMPVTMDIPVSAPPPLARVPPVPAAAALSAGAAAPPVSAASDRPPAIPQAQPGAQPPAPPAPPPNVPFLKGA